MNQTYRVKHTHLHLAIAPSGHLIVPAFVRPNDPDAHVVERLDVTDKGLCRLSERGDALVIDGEALACVVALLGKVHRNDRQLYRAICGLFPGSMLLREMLRGALYSYMPTSRPVAGDGGWWADRVNAQRRQYGQQLAVSKDQDARKS